MVMVSERSSCSCQRPEVQKRLVSGSARTRSFWSDVQPRGEKAVVFRSLVLFKET